MDKITLQEIISIYKAKKTNSDYDNWSLEGEIGSGKTFFVKQLVEKICPPIAQEVSSPTFSYFHIHQHKEIYIHHFDLYRIEEEEKLHEIGVWESLADKNSLTLIEWANLFPKVQQACNFKLHFFLENDIFKIIGDFADA